MDVDVDEGETGAGNVSNGGSEDEAENSSSMQTVGESRAWVSGERLGAGGGTDSDEVEDDDDEDEPEPEPDEEDPDADDEELVAVAVALVVAVPVLVTVAGGDRPATLLAVASSPPAATSSLLDGDPAGGEVTALGSGGAGVAKISLLLLWLSSRSSLHSSNSSTYSEYMRCHSECGFRVSSTHCISSSLGTT